MAQANGAQVADHYGHIYASAPPRYAPLHQADAEDTRRRGRSCSSSCWMWAERAWSATSGRPVVCALWLILFGVLYCAWADASSKATAFDNNCDLMTSPTHETHVCCAKFVTDANNATTCQSVKRDDKLRAMCATFYDCGLKSHFTRTMDRLFTFGWGASAIYKPDCPPVQTVESGWGWFFLGGFLGGLCTIGALAVVNCVSRVLRPHTPHQYPGPVYQQPTPMSMQMYHHYQQMQQQQQQLESSEALALATRMSDRADVTSSAPVQRLRLEAPANPTQQQQQQQQQRRQPTDFSAVLARIAQRARQAQSLQARQADPS